MLHIFYLQVGVKNLKVLGSEAWDLMREGEAEKQVYCFILNCCYLGFLKTNPYNIVVCNHLKL